MSDAHSSPSSSPLHALLDTVKKVAASIPPVVADLEALKRPREHRLSSAIYVLKNLRNALEEATLTAAPQTSEKELWGVWIHGELCVAFPNRELAEKYDSRGEVRLLREAQAGPSDPSECGRLITTAAGREARCNRDKGHEGLCVAAGPSDPEPTTEAEWDALTKRLPTRCPEFRCIAIGEFQRCTLVKGHSRPHSYESELREARPLPTKEKESK